MGNNLENKAKFFALYYGQRVLCVQGGDDKLMPLSHWNTIQFEAPFYSSWLELKDVKDISIEDANKITIYGEYAINKKNINEYGYQSPYSFEHYHQPSIDFLRSKGYALPFMGLSVEQLINYGWVKLKDNA